MINNWGGVLIMSQHCETSSLGVATTNSWLLLPHSTWSLACLLGAGLLGMIINLMGWRHGMYKCTGSSFRNNYHSYTSRHKTFIGGPFGHHDKDTYLQRVFQTWTFLTICLRPFLDRTLSGVGCKRKGKPHFEFEIDPFASPESAPLLVPLLFWGSLSLPLTREKR